MSDVDAPLPSDERPLAGEYVLGVLDAAGRAQAQHRIAAEPLFAQEVTWWENRLAALALEIGAVQPPAALWTRISNLIGRPVRPGVLDNVRLWRGVSAGAVAVAAAALVFVALPRTMPPVAPPPVPVPQAAEIAVIDDPDTHQPRFVATLDHAARALVITPMNLDVPTGRDAELWIIPEGAAPVSLGVVSKTTPRRIAVPPGLRAAGTYTATLAVTDEPLGGSPTGAPTGRIHAAGKFAPA